MKDYSNDPVHLKEEAAMNDADKLTRLKERARSHPLRVKIIALYVQNESRSLAALDLAKDLNEANANPSAVAYHVRLLQEAQLLPAAG